MPENQISQPVEPEKPKRNWLKILGFTLLGLVVASGVFAAGYFTALKAQPAKVTPLPTPTPQPVAQISPTPFLETIAEWTTYTNENFGFEIKYPTDWTIDSRDFALNKGYLRVLSKRRAAEIEEEMKKGIVETSQPEVFVRVFDAVEELPGATKESLFFASWARDFMTRGCGDSSIKEKDFQESEAFEITTHSCKNGEPLKSLAISRNDKFYLVEKTGNTETADQVFSTFKFLD